MSVTNQQTIDAYNKSAAKYIKDVPQHIDGQMEDWKAWLDACIASLSPSAKILEIGSGHGKDADYLELKGYDVKRTDASESFVEYQNKKGHNASLLNVLTDDITGSFDMVLADAVWLHFTPSEAEAATRKVLDALNEKGHFAFSVKEGAGEELTDRTLNHTRYFCYWQEDKIRSLLERVGFRDISIAHAADYRPDRPGWLLIIAKK